MDIPERGDAASLTEKLDCVTALWPRGGSWGKHGVRGTARHQVCSGRTAAQAAYASMRSSDRRYLHFSLGDGGAIQMLLIVVKETKGRTFWDGRIAREWR